ncbi:MAG: bifunctional metallophosphatase/5'-nucleotidase [Lachnospiraceae bacterium]|nr:bifunctional metallophosphatase/5'-nucleotidase [Lachnospiraceae bacterium]
MKKKFLCMALSAVMATMLSACGTTQTVTEEPAQVVNEESAQTTTEESTQAVNEEPAQTAVEESAQAENEQTTTGEPAQTESEQPVEKNGEVYILVTSDVHCGVNQGFGYAGLAMVRENLEKQGYTTILVDDGDSIQGEAMGTLTQGEADVRLMNAVGYDVAIPGNHEFDYGMDRFLELVDMAEYKYISCNLNKEGELVLDPYVVIDTGDFKIGFVGMTTPESLVSSNPVHFQDETGKTIYGFKQNEDGSELYAAVQDAVDAARAEGADYVYAMGHMGLEEACRPYTYADVISHTNGIDAFLDGHSHDTEQIVMKNKDGKEVYRCAVGTKMHCIGYSLVNKDGIQDTNIWSWPNSIDAPTLLGIDNPVNDAVQTELAAIQDTLNQEVCNISYTLMDKDPEVKDSSGNLIRMVRRAETNLGDLCADAFREATGADIGFINGGGIRAGIDKGEVTYGEIIAVFPFGNNICVIEATGQQILDALEWGSRGVPEENGGFLQVSGLTYDIDSSVDSPCKADEEGNMTGIGSGPRRVSNVLVDGKPIDPAAKYTIGSQSFVLLDHGDGYTCFDGCEVLYPEVCLDNEALINYMEEHLTGGGGSEYAEPYGEGRIVITE